MSEKERLMFFACQKGDLDFIRNLIQSKLVLASGEFGETSFLRAALENQQMETAQFLLREGADANWNCHASGSTCLKMSAEEGDVEVVRFLLQQDNVLIDKPCWKGRSPLLAALDAPVFTNQHLEVVFMLLSAGADPNVAEYEDLKTPLLCAVELLDPRVVDALLENGADPNQADFNMETPLHRLCLLQSQHKMFQVLEALLRFGADVNSRNVGNCTPAHNAGLRGNRVMLTLLTVAGANMGAVNSQFMTPGHYLEDFDNMVAENS